MEVVYIHDKDRRLHRFDLNKFKDVAAYNKILRAKALARNLPKIIRHAEAKRSQSPNDPLDYVDSDGRRHRTIRIDRGDPFLDG